jgi:ribulose-phosphate 3-epimerase
MSRILIAPSILSADFTKLGDEIRLIEEAGADWIHVDVMDGQFVPNITMGPFIVETCRRISKLPIDAHLMIERPENHINAFAKAGVNSLSIHVEGNPNAYRTLQEIRELGCKAGIVINPGTPSSAIFELVKLADYVLVMSVNPGFSGQQFIPQVLRKITEIKKYIQTENLQTIIQMDGGISRENIASAYEAGATWFVAATSIFKHPEGINKAIFELREAVK